MSDRAGVRAGKAETVSEKKTRPARPRSSRRARSTVTATMPVETRASRTLFDPPLPSGPRIGRRIRVAAAARARWISNRARWKDAYLVTFVCDPRGIKSISSATSTGAPRGHRRAAVEQFSIRENLGPYASRNPGSTVSFSYQHGARGNLEPADRAGRRPQRDPPRVRLAPSLVRPGMVPGRAQRRGRTASTRHGGITSVATGGQAKWDKLAADQSFPAARGGGRVPLRSGERLHALLSRDAIRVPLRALHLLRARARGSRSRASGCIPCSTRSWAPPSRSSSCSCSRCPSISPFSSSSRRRQPPALRSSPSTCAIRFSTMPRTLAFFAIFVSLYAALYVLLQERGQRAAAGLAHGILPALRRHDRDAQAGLDGARGALLLIARPAYAGLLATGRRGATIAGGHGSPRGMRFVSVTTGLPRASQAFTLGGS